MPESHIQYWADDRNPTHPIIDELRARPGAWAVLGHCGKGEDHGPEWQAAYNACKRHPNVQMVGILEAGHSDSPIRARWLPDPVVAAMHVLKGGVTVAERLIPVEADDAAEKVSYVWESDVPIEQIRTAILEAAAPHIARAARIDELKLMIGSCIGVGPWESELAVTMRTLRERIAELEAQR